MGMSARAENHLLQPTESYSEVICVIRIHARL